MVFLFFEMRALVFLMVVALWYTYSAAATCSESSKMPAEPIKLYYLPPSPPCRAVMMLAKALGLEMELILINLIQGEHLTPEFLKMNPQHTIPTINDNGFILWESRAIMSYLANAYGQNEFLYPKNPRSRAVVDQRMNFDLGTLYARYITLYQPALVNGSPLDEDHIEQLHEALGFLEKMLEGKAFVAGDNLTLPDFSIIVTISNLDVFGFDLSNYENINKWYDRTKRALEPYDYVGINENGAKVLASFLNKNSN